MYTYGEEKICTTFGKSFKPFEGKKLALLEVSRDETNTLEKGE